MSSINSIKSLLNIQDENIIIPEQDFKIVVNKNNVKIKVIKAFLRSKPCSCPNCSSKNIVRNSTRTRKIRLINFQNYAIQIDLNIQRYLCKECKKTFSLDTKIVKKFSNISFNLKKAIAIDLKTSISLTDIAKRYSVSISTIQRIMDTAYKEYTLNKKFLPEVICVDEFKSTKNIDGAMSFVFADANSKKIIDIVEDRRLNSLIEYFGKFSFDARNNVKYIVSDMYAPYFSLSKQLFPNSKIVLDKFHIVNLISTSFNKTRIAVMKNLKAESSKNKLKKFWKLFLKPYESLCDKRYYCTSFKSYLTSKEKLNRMLNFHPELDANYNVYQSFLQAISDKNFKKFKNIIFENLKNKNILSKPMIKALLTLKKYLQYIENTFKTNYTNGLIEGINNKIKSIKRVAFGYRKFTNFRKRVLIQLGIIELSYNF